MRTGIAIICLLSFVALQYGKLLNYWQCRLIAATSTEFCECEKYLDEHTEKGVFNSTTASLLKEKTEDISAWQPFPGHIVKQLPTKNTPSSCYQSLIPENHSKNIFHPPKI